MQLNFEGKDKAQASIARIQAHYNGRPLYLAFSGGKDSVVTHRLMILSGVPFTAHYNVTGIDPPELVQFIKRYYPDVQWHMPEKSMFRFIVENHGLPRRQGRWCCAEMKERSGSGEIVVTGIRWAESARRSKRGMFEQCRNDGTKWYLNPIIDWSTQEVWDFIKSKGLPYCSLYDEGFKRLGCVLCPMTTARQTQLEIKRFPKIAEAWHRAAIRRWETHRTPGTIKFVSGEAFWQWWISREAEPIIDDSQCRMFE